MNRIIAVKLLVANILPLILSNYLFSQVDDSRLTVMVFLGIDCPISQDYVVTLNNIHEQYKGFVKIEGVFPGKCKQRSVSQFNRDYSLNFSTKTDRKNRIAKKLKATVTPEVFLFDRSGKVIYRGAIDNWYFELGRHRSSPTEYFLLDAIGAAIAGEEIKIKETKSIGCFIEKVK